MSVLSISKILLPVDFSARSEEVVRYGARLAKLLQAELILLHVLEPLHLDFAMAELPGSVERIVAAQRSRAQSRLEHFASADLEGITVVRRISQGRPPDEIVAQAANADLVVMPTQGHGRIREFLIGSVTAKVLHDCERPVLTGVHLTDSRNDPSLHVGNVLCAIDFGPESGDVLRWGARLASEFGSAITVVHASSDPGDAQRLDRFIQSADLKATPVLTPGEPHKVVVETAERIGANVVIIGRGSSTGALGRLHAQAYAIVRKSPCPVLSV
ncbi:MAG: universal stress protein [Bryobacteraceae bacterium]